ncbi:thiamine ABC transporter substrate-binding protein [Anaerolineales bacterium HSG24]|nr:thiamine ABC transporter substrate-binding protein [Anaerolineales bacterium HSG24]
MQKNNLTQLINQVEQPTRTVDSASLLNRQYTLAKEMSLLFFILLMLIGCSPPSTPESTEPTSIKLMTHNSFAISEEVLAEFETMYNVKVDLLLSGDTGAALNQAILSKDTPLADVFFGVDNSFLSRALENQIFEPYNSPMLSAIPDALELDGRHHLLPVDYGDVCLNYDKSWFAKKGIAPPTTLEDLIEPEYASLVVVENPATSSPGLSFLLTTIAHFGEDGYLDYWQKLDNNDVLVVDSWNEAYYVEFSRYEGTRPLVVSYATSPPAEVLFSEEPLDDAPTASVLGDEACFRQIEFVGILVGTKQRALSEKLIDFMLDQRFQEDIPLNMFVFPANETSALPELFEQYGEQPANPASLSPSKISTNREAWINAWTETVLR